MRTTASILLILSVVLAACDQPRDREQKLNPRPEAPSLAETLPPARSAADALPRVGAYAWNAEAGVFTLDGTRLEPGHLWTFEGSTRGFVMAGGQVAPAEEAGLAIALRAFDPILRTPSGLDLDGARFGLVLVRLTRVAAGEAWDGSLYYTTAEHGESADFVGRPLQGAAPQVNETVILAYDMHNPMRGGDDWATSKIDQVRLDLDDKPGGEFIVHQVAIVEAPTRPQPTLRPGS